MNEIVSYEDMSGINILTDARHGTRKNSMFSDVVCILTPVATFFTSFAKFFVACQESLVEKVHLIFC
jgi:hypothetical protein